MAATMFPFAKFEVKQIGDESEGENHQYIQEKGLNAFVKITHAFTLLQVQG
jgi:hypothetical protein